MVLEFSSASALSEESLLPSIWEYLSIDIIAREPGAASHFQENQQVNYKIYCADFSFLWSTQTMNIPFKKVKAKVKPMLNSIVRPNKAKTDIQYKYPSKFNPRLSRTSFPIVVFAESICV